MPGGHHFVGYVASRGAPVGRKHRVYADQREGLAMLSSSYEVTVARAGYPSGRTGFVVSF